MATIVQVSSSSAGEEGAASDDSFVITNVRIFDGQDVIQNGTLVVRNGKIKEFGSQVAIPENLPLINGSGKTILPGLIDSHTHSDQRSLLERALMFGVTTELDMWNPPSFDVAMRREERRTGAPYRATIYSAGNGATVPGGWPYSFSEVSGPTLSTPAEAADFVRDRLAEGSDYVKIFIEDGSVWGLQFPVIDAATVAAVVEAAHQRHKLTVAHVTEAARAGYAVQAGVDCLEHIIVDAVADTSLIQAMVEKGTCVTPTLNIVETLVGTDGGVALANDPQLAPYLTPDESALLQTPVVPFLALPASALVTAKQNVLLMKQAGIPILAGTDPFYPTHGMTLHRELELLCQAGLTPLEALAAATSIPAGVFGLSDRGKIEAGRRADLLLVDGDPTTDIKATRAIVSIWKAGILFDRLLPSSFQHLG